ncbi:methyltransferase family protein [Hyphomonas sp.]|uniref:methyltransferase family protein n=1 Tax=Hyphomonas sp. TaxID=87 RepID=UPI003F726156
MKRLVFGLYATASYTVGMASILYLCGFMLNLLVPKGIDTGTPGPLVQSILVNITLLSAFLVPHSVMARPGFKKWWTTIVPERLERATYIFFSGATLSITLWFWQPIPVILFTLDAGLASVAAYTIYAFGWAMIVISTFSLDHFSFFGLRQAWETFTGALPKQEGLSESWFYAIVRHPISVGWMLVVLSTPVMTIGHLLFATGMVAYIFIVTPFEERDIEAVLGEDYRDYRRRVRAFLPLRKT